MGVPIRVFFSKFLMGGGPQNFWSPTGTKSDGGGGGGTCEKNLTEAKNDHLMHN